MKKTDNRIEFTVASVREGRYQPFYDRYGREVPRWVLYITDTDGEVYEWLTSVEVRAGMIIRATPIWETVDAVRITQGRVVGFAW